MEANMLTHRFSRIFLKTLKFSVVSAQSVPNDPL